MNEAGDLGSSDGGLRHGGAAARHRGGCLTCLTHRWYFYVHQDDERWYLVFGTHNIDTESPRDPTKEYRSTRKEKSRRAARPAPEVEKDALCGAVLLDSVLALEAQVCEEALGRR